MKRLTKESLTRKLDEKDFHKPIRKDWIQAARKNNLVIVYSNHLDFIHIDGAVTECVYADCVPFFLARHGLVRNKNSDKTLEIHPYRFGKRRGEEMSPALYARLGKPVWDFCTDEIAGKAAPFRIQERQDFGETAKYFCRGIVVDLHELLPV